MQKCGNDSGWNAGGEGIRIPTACPSCNADWYKGDYGRWKLVKELLRLRNLVRSPQDDPAFQIRLELVEPPD